MEEIHFDAALEAMLDSLLNGRLVLLAGAGLSMSPPTNLPSAATIAAEAKHRFDATYGESRPPLSSDIEEQAQYFYDRGELDKVYFSTLVDQHAFSAPPNAGHFAAADLLLTRMFCCAVTTNVDALVEAAGMLIHGQVATAIDGQGAAGLHDVSPLVKIHGCRLIDPQNMVWAPGQLSDEPVKGRIAHSKNWLQTNLVNRDILIVGFWTDWNYLNEALAEVLDTINPTRVIVVSPADTKEFEEKAPELFQLGQRSELSFQHAKTYGDQFLDELRRAFSLTFLRRVLHSGAGEYQEQSGNAPSAQWLEPTQHDSQTLWQIRRDLEGRTPNEPAKEKGPDQGESLVGLTLLQLRAAGAIADGQYWKLDDKRVRVIRAVNKPLHRVKEAHLRELAPAVAPDIAIAVGAEELSLPPNIARNTTSASVARGQSTTWLTRQKAVESLGL